MSESSCPQTTDAAGDDGSCATRNAHAAVAGIPSATAHKRTTKWRLTVFGPDDRVAIQLPLTDEQAESIMPVAEDDLITGDWPIGEAYLERVRQ